MLRSLLLALCILSSAFYTVKNAAEEAVAVEATVEAAEKVATASAVQPVQVDGKVTLRNEMSEVVLDVEWAEITDFRLLDHHPLKLKEALGGDSSLDPTGPLSVLGSIHPNKRIAGHNSISVATKGWKLASHSERSAVFVKNEGVFQYTLTCVLDEGVARLSSSLAVLNTDKQDEPLLLELTAINGVHQDSAKQDAFYNGLFVYEDDNLITLDTPALSTKGQSQGKLLVRDMTNANYVAIRSRFFAALWSFDGLTVKSDVHAEKPKSKPSTAERRPSVMDEDTGVKATVDQGSLVAARISLYSKAFFAGPEIARQHQMFVNIKMDSGGGKPFQIAPQETYTFNWTTTITSMRKSDLALLSEVEQDLEFSSFFYRFFRMFSNILLWMMDMVNSAFVAIGLEAISYGLAVMSVTAIVKGLMHKMTYKQQYSMMKMQQLGPELKRLQAQYKGDRQAMATKQMELWKKNGVNPLGGCLPMLIQMPIFIALFQAFSHAGDLRGHGFFWVVDLTLQDQTWPLGFNWPVLGTPASINLLPILYLPVALFQSLAMKMTAPNSGDQQKDDMQASMQKMFRFMPIFFFGFIYFFPAGLVLYITVSSLWSLIEIRMIRKSLGLDKPAESKTTEVKAT